MDKDPLTEEPCEAKACPELAEGSHARPEGEKWRQRAIPLPTIT